MQIFARVTDGVVQEIITIADDADVHAMFHADIVSTMHACSDTVVVGWHYADAAFSAPPVVLPTKEQLTSYARKRQSSIAQSGISVNIGSAGSPKMVEASTDAYSFSLLNTAVNVAASNPSATTAWVPADADPVTLTATQVLEISTAVNSFIQSTFATLAAVITAINAGSVTTYAQVDAFSAPAWPSNS